MRCLGIDFGAHSTRAAHLSHGRAPALLPDGQFRDRLSTPSLVGVTPHSRIVGQVVIDACEGLLELAVVQNAKWNLLARRTAADHTPSRDRSRSPGVSPGDLPADLLPARAAVSVLEKINADARAHPGDDESRAVITVSPLFSELEREALVRAAEAAGWQVRALVEEPLAAASYFQSLSSGDRTMLIFHLGSGAFDISIVRCVQGEVKLLASVGERDGAGAWIDQRIADVMLGEYERQYGLADAADRSQLLRLAGQLKCRLSQPGCHQVREQSFVGNRPFEFVLTRIHLEQLLAPSLLKQLNACERLLSSVELSWKDIDVVHLIGGCTLIPAVQSRIVEQSGLSPSAVVSLHAEAAVALGAALLAGHSDEQLAFQIAAMKSEVAPHDLGIRIHDPAAGRPAIYKLIKRNSALPAVARKQFRTSRANQTRLVIEVVQSKGSASSAQRVAYFKILLPAGLPANHPVEVILRQDSSGRITLQT